MKTRPFTLLVPLIIFGCSTSSISPNRSPADESFDEENSEYALKLTGLGMPHFYYGKPDAACLQRFIDERIAQSKIWAKTTKNKEVLDYPGDPTLAKNIINTAIVSGIDPYIFAGIIYQESGDFVPHINGGGSGLTAMTGIAIQDLCLNLEATDCKDNYKPKKYAKVWEDKAADILSILYPNSKPESEYPWRRFCSTPPKNYCQKDCGIDDSSTCMKETRRGVYKHTHSSLFMGSFSFMNQLASALSDDGAKGTELKNAYLVALRNYNGHPTHKHVYPGQVIDRIERIKGKKNAKEDGILKSCPPIQKPEQMVQ